jgi:hypothetical protein
LKALRQPESWKARDEFSSVGGAKRGIAPLPHRQICGGIFCLHLVAGFGQDYRYFQFFLASEDGYFDGVPCAVIVHHLR